MSIHSSSAALIDSLGSRTVDIYPLDTPLDDLKKYRCVKQLHVIRHAEGTHNVNQEYRDARNLDARLTDKGEDQCRALAARLEDGDPDLFEAQLVVTSPMTRCIQTTLLTLDPVLRQNTNLPVLANELIRETVNYNCDRRRDISEISNEFGRVDCSLIDHNVDPIWARYEERLGSATECTRHRESSQLYKVAERARRFFEWLETRPEEKVIICSHRAYLRCLWNFGRPEGVPYQPEQYLDDRDEPKDVPVVRYRGDETFQAAMMRDYDNCELRSMIVAFS